MTILRHLAIVAATMSQSVYSQYRLIKAHSIIEDRLISSNLDEFNSMRFHVQSPEFLAKLSHLSPLVSIKHLKHFSNQEYHFFEWNNPEYFGNTRQGFGNWKLTQKLGEHFFASPNRAYSWESSDKQDYVVINPVLDLLYSPKMGSIFNTALVNGRGIEIQAQFSDKITLYSQVFDYQHNYTQNLDDFYTQNKVYQGITFYQRTKSGLVSNFYATGYIQAKIIEKKNSYHISTTFGHDRQFVGSGYRSLILSNFAPPSLFLQVNYSLGPFKYQNLFKELVRDMTEDSFRVLNKKFLAMHRGSLEFKKLNFELGFSEMIIHSRTNNQFDANYFNPIILYRSVERDLGSPDNAMLAFDFKWTPKKQWLVYGQLLLDEFTMGKVINQKNYYGNKFGQQLGIYYSTNSHNTQIKDQAYVQLEYNRVRPHTYSHFSSSYYSHFSHALAHPLESNFREIALRAFWVPAKIQKLEIKCVGIFAQKGQDTAGLNFGGSLFKSYRTAYDRQNAIMLQGAKQSIIQTQLTARYYLFPGGSIELNYQLMKNVGFNAYTRNYLGFGIRWNFYDQRDNTLR